MRVVTETECSKRVPRNLSASIIVPLPTPDGPDKQMSKPFLTNHTQQSSVASPNCANKASGVMADMTI